MPPSLQIVTLGCSKNTVDTEHLLASLDGAYEIVPEGEDCGKLETLLINTCGFIGDAKEQSIGAIMEAVRRKNEGRVGRLIVFGCLSQRYMDTLPGLIPEVDEWYGARDLRPVAQALGCEYKDGRVGTHHPYAYLKISEGCDRRCAYCAIPFIRGAHRSVPIDDLAEESRQLALQGAKELILIAQDSTYYGLDLYQERALGRLVDALSEVEGIERIRIHYSYPADFPEDVLDRMVTNPKLCRYLDLPLQHVSDKVLGKMHRGVDGAWTRELVRRIRSRVPGVVLRTTMIVGHPYEGERDFRELLDFVRETRFERLGAFAYSREEGTFAGENYRNTVSARLKQARLAALMELQREISHEYNLSRVGSRVRVLVDSVSGDKLVCRSEFESPDADGEILVGFNVAMGTDDPEKMVGRFIEVRITEADDYDLIGEYEK